MPELNVSFFNTLNNQSKAIIYMLFKGYTIDSSGAIRNKERSIVEGFLDRYGYRVLGIRLPAFVIKGRHKGNKCVSFHRYQALRKYGLKIFEKGIHVRHKNNDKLDNSWDNILIGTPSENYYDRIPEDRFNHAMKATSSRKDLIVDIIDDIKEDREKK